MKSTIDPKEYGALIENVKDIKSDVAESHLELIRIKTILEDKYATKEWVHSEYGPTKRTVNWVAYTVGAIVLTALLSLILIKR